VTDGKNRRDLDLAGCVRAVHARLYDLGFAICAQNKTPPKYRPEVLKYL
jgi:hypothetical protein